MHIVFQSDERFNWLHFLPLKFDNLICVDCKHLDPFNTTIVSNVYNSVLKLKSQTPNNKILFFNLFEGFQKDVHKSINDIIIQLVHSNVCSVSDFIIVNGSYPNQHNAKLYQEFITENNFLKIKTYLVNTMELSFVGYLNDDLKTNLSLLQYNIENKDKNFLLYIGKVTQHRIYVLHQLSKLNLLENSYYTCYFEKKLIDSLVCDGYPDYMKDSIRYIQKISDTLPIKLNEKDNFENLCMWGFNMDEKFHVTDTFFSVIPETHFCHNKQNLHEHFILADQIFITEKTLRTIAAKHPFVIIGFTNTLQVLRDAGYKTFHPYIDESYDLIENDEHRLIAIKKEIERLCNLSKEERVEWSKGIIPIIEYNQKVLFNVSPKYIDIY